MTYLDTPTEQKYKRNQNPDWTEAKVKQLRQLAKDGLSGSKIAHELGFATRSAVIGKLHRLGITKNKSLHHNQQHRAKGAAIQPANVCPQVIAQAHFTKKRRLRISLVESTNPTEPVVIKPSEFDLTIPQEQRRTILQLNGHTCHWPIGNPDQPDFFFCGAYTNHVYCRHHAARAYRT